ncbi:MAG TPA: hypothetical protein VFE55_12410 [Acidimicrobiia bacterium]|nr:hypothetical protein [Acidimicrobiia bacterium]
MHDRAGLLVGIVAEEPATRPGRPSTFAVVHNPGPTPFVLRFPRVLRARGAWWSKGHGTVAAAVGSLAGYLGDQSPASRRHHLTGPSR